MGSCTMKYNPRFADYVASLGAYSNTHPATPSEFTQGTLEILNILESYLTEITGMDVASFQPPAGASGELTGLLIIKKYLENQNLSNKTEIIVPDSAHGTNPASARMAGFKVVEVATDERGMVNIDDLHSKVNENTAGLMLTNPNTGGLFEEEILTISTIIHDAGGLLYYDGANLNAIVGVCRPGDMGFDIVHSNLHKTFATPHGGGGPGSGPIGVKAHLSKYLPSPLASRREITDEDPEGVGDGFWYSWTSPEKSIGKVQQWHGNAGAVVRCWAFYRRYGRELEKMSEHAVLNANYLRFKIMNPDQEVLSKIHAMPSDGAPTDFVMHEFTLSMIDMKDKVGVTGKDLAKRLLDYGVMAPTLYFPMIVPECLMIEPTETESKEVLDKFADDFLNILTEDPELIKGAPYSTDVSRVDEVWAARNLILRHPGNSSEDN